MSGLESQLPTLITVLTAAAIDSINPCAIGVLILMVTVVLSQHGSVKKLLGLGLLYIFAVFLTYLLAGLGLIYFLSKIPLALTEYISIFVGSLIIFAGLLEIKDYFWYGKWFSLSIPVRATKKIHEMSKKATIPGVFLLGAFVSGVELPCTGAPYLAIILILQQYFDFYAFLLLVLYNVVFVLPLVIILFLVVGGVGVAKVKQWKDINRPLMRLAIGLMLVFLGWLLMLIANGTVNFG